MTKKYTIFTIPIIGIISVLSLFYFHTPRPAQSKKYLINDVSRLNPTYVKEIVRVKDVDQLRKLVLNARKNNLKISIAGKKHSQGGHQFCDDCIVLDMTGFNKIISLDRSNKVITVQSGATWAQIQEYIAPYRLAIKVMQASNIFTVGGSMSADIHGNDPNEGAIIDTIRAFRLLTGDGSVRTVSRIENPELFPLVVGGYGLFGVILDADLELTNDVAYERNSIVMDYKEYPPFFQRNILNNRLVGLHSAKLSIAPESFLTELVATSYIKTDQKVDQDIFTLQQEENILRNKLFFGASRKTGVGKSARWLLEKKLDAKVGEKGVVSRNNAMRSIVKFLDYYSEKDTDILQEYYIPTENFIRFVDQLRETIQKEDINILSVTVRYMPQDTESFLSYASRPCYAIVLYINQELSEEGIQKAEKWTQQIVNLALGLNGTYYLPYQLYPTREQMRQAYPQADLFFKKKKFYDEKEMFVNNFYKKYSRRSDE